MRELARRLRDVGIELWLPALLIVGWWFWSAGSTSVYFPPLSKILPEFWFIVTNRFASDVVPSVMNATGGLIIGVAVGIACGVAVGLNRRLREAMTPLLEFLRSLPSIALLPAAVALLGIGSEAKVALIALAVLWPVLLNTADGVRSISPELWATVRGYRLRRGDTLFRVVLPAATPQIFTGLRLAVSVAVLLIVASEYYASTAGLGYIELDAARRYQMATMWGGLLVLAVIGYLANVLLRMLESKLLRWHRAMTG